MKSPPEIFHGVVIQLSMGIYLNIQPTWGNNSMAARLGEEWNMAMGMGQNLWKLPYLEE